MPFLRLPRTTFFSAARFSRLLLHSSSLLDSIGAHLLITDCAHKSIASFVTKRVLRGNAEFRVADFHTVALIKGRVTRLGECLPFGRLFTLASCLKIIELAQSRGLLIHRKCSVMNFTKK
jgi:hypothetical protein